MGSGVNCASVTSSENKVLQLKSKKVLVYRCKSCDENGGDSPKLIEAIASLQSAVKSLTGAVDYVNKLKSTVVPAIHSDIKGLKVSNNNLESKVDKHIMASNQVVEGVQNTISDLSTKVNKLEEVVPTLSTAAAVPSLNNAQGVIDEIEERKKRECNLIIFNADDFDEESYVLDKNAQLVSSVLAKINNIKTVFNSSNVKRLGDYETDKKRPILVKMRHHNEVSNVLMHWNLIKKPFSVSFDLTPYQREQFKVLKNQADAFNASIQGKKKWLFALKKAILGFSKLTLKRKTKKAINQKNNKISGFKYYYILPKCARATH